MLLTTYRYPASRSEDRSANSASFSIVTLSEEEPSCSFTAHSNFRPEDIDGTFELTVANVKEAEQGSFESTGPINDQQRHVLPYFHCASLGSPLLLKGEEVTEIELCKPAYGYRTTEFPKRYPQIGSLGPWLDIFERNQLNCGSLRQHPWIKLKEQAHSERIRAYKMTTVRIDQDGLKGYLVMTRCMQFSPNTVWEVKEMTVDLYRFDQEK